MSTADMDTGIEAEISDAMEITRSSVTPSTGSDGAYKDFSLTLGQLFVDLKEPFDFHPAEPRIIKEGESDESFEKVEIPSPFVTAAIHHSQRVLTEKGAPTFNTSDDARVDFFFHVMEQSSRDVVIDLLEKAWNLDPLDTLKLISSLRDIKDGKGIRQQYQHCLYWLYQNHPLTLYHNLPHLLKLGYWKDALDMLVVALFDGFVHPHFAYDDGNKNQAQEQLNTGKCLRRRRCGGKRKSQRKPRQSDYDKRIYNVTIAKHYRLENAHCIKEIPRKAMDSARFRFAREAFMNSPKYRTFHVRIAQLFATQLGADAAVMGLAGKTNHISLAAKWTPSLEGHFDRYTLIGTTIALELAKILEKGFLTSGKSVQTVTYLARKFYNKEFCVPLRAQLELPEREMSAGNWSNVNYRRVSAKCMAKNKAHFIKHDNERLTEYLTRDKAKVAGATLKPIDIIRSAMSLSEATPKAEKIIMEKQWISLVDDIKKKGSLLAGAIAVCDVSGSMHGDPLLAAVGLTLLTMEQTRAPWNEVCITFDEHPTMFHLKPELNLAQKVDQLRRIQWGGTTNFQATLDLVLGLGVRHSLPQAEMPQILLVFTDMEFDAAFPNTSMTNFEHARQSFAASGYLLPTIVFWNLRADSGSKSTPVQKNENGVILLSGFSGQLLSFVMNTTDLANCTPCTFVKRVIDSNKYREMKIYD